MKLYAVHDKKQGALTHFHALEGDAVASRSFQDAVLAKDSVFGRYAEDFELVALAELEKDTTKEVEFVQPYVGMHVVLTAMMVLQLSMKLEGRPELVKEA